MTSFYLIHGGAITRRQEQELEIRRRVSVYRALKTQEEDIDGQIRREVALNVVVALLIIVIALIAMEW